MSDENCCFAISIQAASDQPYAQMSPRWLFAYHPYISCASSGVVKNVSPVATGVPISHDFVVVRTSSALGDVEPQKKLLNALIISGLQETKKFGRVSGNQIAISPNSGIKVNADIKEVDAVSDIARVMVGAFAGQARIFVRVTISV
jgi:hypothetical protein